MQRGARFSDVPLGGPTWPSEGVRNIYNPISKESKHDGVPEADAKD